MTSDLCRSCRNCSDLRLDEEGAALGKGVQPVQPPGAEEGGERHLGGGAGGGAGAAADLAGCHQMAQAALGGVVGGGDSGVFDEDEERAQVVGHALAQGALWHRVVAQIRRAQRPQFRFVALALALAARRVARGVGGVFLGPLIQGMDAVRPAAPARGGRVLIDQGVDIAQQMGPALLVAPLVGGVGGIKVADQHPGVVLADGRLQHGAFSRAADEEPLARRAEGPGVAVAPVLAPAATMAPTLRCSPCPASRYHWIRATGRRNASRKVAIRLSSPTPSRPWPTTASASSGAGSQRPRQRGQRRST